MSQLPKYLTHFPFAADLTRALHEHDLLDPDDPDLLLTLRETDLDQCLQSVLTLGQRKRVWREIKEQKKKDLKTFKRSRSRSLSFNGDVSRKGKFSQFFK